MKLKNKLFILLFLFTVLFLLLNTNVFAFSDDFESIDNFQLFDDLDWNTVKQNFSNDDIDKFNHFSMHVFIYYPEHDFIFIACSNHIYYRKNDVQEILLYNNGKAFFQIKPDGTVKNTSYTPNSTGVNTLCDLTVNNLIYTDSDIYDQTGENLVFQPPPQAEPTILAPIVEGVGTQKTLAEILVILPKILVVLVSCLGLRKVLKMLLALLHRS